MKAEAIIENRKKWLAVNRIQDWNDADTLHVCKLIAELAFDAGVNNGCKEFIDKNYLGKRFTWAGEQPPTKEQFINDLFNTSKTEKS